MIKSLSFSIFQISICLFWILQNVFLNFCENKICQLKMMRFERNHKFKRKIWLTNVPSLSLEDSIQLQSESNNVVPVKIWLNLFFFSKSKIRFLAEFYNYFCFLWKKKNQTTTTTTLFLHNPLKLLNSSSRQILRKLKLKRRTMPQMTMRLVVQMKMKQTSPLIRLPQMIIMRFRKSKMQPPHKLQ